MAATGIDRAGPWHFDDLADLPDDDRRYEVVDGLLVVSPPPSPGHQLVSNRLQRQLLRQCPAEWEVLLEFALPLGTDGRVPDLSVVRSGLRVRTMRRAPYPGPEQVGLVVEVVSPSSRKTDRFAKPGEYAEAGIPMFWRVEPDPDLALFAFVLRDGQYAEVTRVTDRGSVPVPWGTAMIDLAEVADG